jgi:hypothetical protein
MAAFFSWSEDAKEAAFPILDAAIDWVDAHDHESAEDYTAKEQEIQGQLTKALSQKTAVHRPDL